MLEAAVEDALMFTVCVAQAPGPGPGHGPWAVPGHGPGAVPGHGHASSGPGAVPRHDVLTLPGLARRSPRWWSHTLLGNGSPPGPPPSGAVGGGLDRAALPFDFEAAWFAALERGEVDLSEDEVPLPGTEMGAGAGAPAAEATQVRDGV